jgi:hypothetical protein
VQATSDIDSRRVSRATACETAALVRVVALPYPDKAVGWRVAGDALADDPMTTLFVAMMATCGVRFGEREAVTRRLVTASRG